MSFQASSESMQRYSSEQMHDGILSEQDHKYFTDFLNTLSTEEPPNNMMGITHHSTTSLSFPEQSTMAISRGFSPEFPNFEANTAYIGAGGYIYQSIGSSSITIPANNGYPQPSFQPAPHVHNNFVQPSYPITHQISTLNNETMHGSVGKTKSTSNNQSSTLHIKSEPISNRRQRSSSPTHQVNVIYKQTLKRTPSRRKSIKNSNDLIETNSDEGNNNSSSHPHASSSGVNAISRSTSPTPGSPKQLATESNNSQSISTPTPSRGGRGKKGHHELLTEAEKKANHIASEQKRRQNIRLGFDQLVEIVPTLSQCHRSEALILQKSVEYIQQLLMQKNELKERVKSLQVTLGDAPDHLDDSSSDGELDLIF